MHWIVDRTNPGKYKEEHKVQDLYDLKFLENEMSDLLDFLVIYTTLYSLKERNIG